MAAVRPLYPLQLFFDPLGMLCDENKSFLRLFGLTRSVECTQAAECFLVKNGKNVIFGENMDNLDSGVKIWMTSA